MVFSGFVAAAGSVLADVSKRGLDSLAKTSIYKGVSSFAKRNIKTGVQPVANAAKGFGAAAKARQTARFSSTMGEKVASKLPLGTGAFFKPVQRVLPNSAEGLTGAALKAQEKLIRKSKDNLYIGMKLNKPAQAAVAGAAVLGIAGKQAYSDIRKETYGDAMNTYTEQTGDMPRMNSDMVGGVQNGRRDLGASGDIVLAMNKRRHG